jgi:hypothetical protein
MAYNGSGTFLINTAGQPVVANTVISATVFNALTADLATGLSTAITKDGQTTITANIPFASNKITGLGAGTLATDAAQLGQVQSTAAKLITVSGTDTITGTMSPTLTAYAAGQLFYFVAAGANTTTVTLNVDGLGAKAVTRDGSTALAAGDINSGEVVVVIYDGTRFQMINAANSFGNTTINGTLTVTGNTGLQANVSITSALSVGGVFAVTGNAGFQANVSITSALSIGGVFAVTGASTLTSASISTGNLTFSSTAQRITGDMSNATLANRLAFQTSTTNGNTTLNIIPNGTGTASQFVAHMGSDPANTSRAGINVNSSQSAALVFSDITGTGTYLPLTFYTGGSERMRLDTSGNLLVNTSAAPPAGATAPNITYRTANGGGIWAQTTSTTNNVGFRAAVDDYDSSFTNTSLNQFGSAQTGTTYGIANADLGALQFTNVSNAVIGTNGANLIFAPNGASRMLIDSSGNVGIGTSTLNKSSSSTALTVNTGTAANYSAVEWASGDTLNYHINANNSAIFHVAAGTRPWIVYTNGSERLRIDSEGRVGIGGTASAFAKTQVLGTLPVDGNTSISFYTNATIPSGAASEGQGFRTNLSTAAASFTLGNLRHFQATQATIGAGSTVTNQFGFIADNTLTGATNNFGFYSDIASGSNRWNFYANGTANNYFAGEVYCGTTGRINATASPLSSYATTGSGFVVQMTQSANDTISVWNSATTGDNDFIDFYTEGAATLRGNITYNRGAGQVAYNVTSDVRLKENIADAEDAGNKIDAMQVRQFDWKETGNHLDYGFVAQELHNVAPHAVSKPEDEDAMWSVDYSKLVPMLVKEIQSLRARVATLEAK